MLHTDPVWFMYVRMVVLMRRFDAAHGSCVVYVCTRGGVKGLKK
jgi:hypothetical protein